MVRRLCPLMALIGGVFSLMTSFMLYYDEVHDDFRQLVMDSTGGIRRVVPRGKDSPRFSVRVLLIFYASAIQKHLLDTG